MGKRLGNTQLFIIFGILVFIYGVYRYINAKKGENTFHTHIIPKIDSAKVNGMLIYTSAKKGEPMRFTLKDKKWMITQSGYTTLADDKAESYVIEQIRQISPDRLATSDPAQWKDFNVMDTMGTRLVLLNNTDTLLYVIVGRFGFNPQGRQGISYMRLHGQNEVYGVEGFLALNITQDADSWRNRRTVSQDEHSWSKLTFTYPGDSSYIVQKDSNDRWHFGDNKKVDSLGTATTIHEMAMQNYGKFAYKFDTNSVKPIYTLLIEGRSISPILIKAYPDAAEKLVITSSINPGAYFSEAKSKMFDKLFPGKNSFLHHVMPKKNSVAAATKKK